MSRSTILLHGIEFVGRHGVEERERCEGRPFRVDCEVEVERLAGFDTDRIGDTVDYTELARVIEAVGTGPSCYLVERLAEKMAAACLALTHVHRVRLEVAKRASGVPGNPAWVGVRIERERSDLD